MPKEGSANFRRKARAFALQALYELDVTERPAGSSFEWLKTEMGLPEESASYSLELMEGVTSRRHEIDRAIHKFAPAWPVNQLPVVDRNILRMALFEIHFGHGVPRKVAINEAVELAKTFGSESSPRFVNGVLGSVMDEMQQIETRTEEPTVLAANNLGQEGDVRL